MTRREFISLLGGAAAWPLVARAQQSSVQVIGILSSTSPDEYRDFEIAFLQGLGERGYIEGHNVAFEYRWARGQYDRLPALAAELVVRRVALIATIGGGSIAALAAKAATTTIPIVFHGGGDPVYLGLVASLNRPGGNITGVSTFSTLLIQKRLELLRELVPRVAEIAMLVNPKNPNAKPEMREVQAAAVALGFQLRFLDASNERELDITFANIVQQQSGALLVQGDPFFNGHRAQIVALAAGHKIPAIYTLREYTVAGGLISYGPRFSETYRQTGNYAGQILKGAKPGDLPVMQPSKFDLAVNLNVARGLGLSIPSTILARADEVIE